MNIFTFLTLFPFVVFLYLLLFRKVSLLNSSVVAFVLFFLLSIFIWQMETPFLAASLVKGFFVALDILFIIIGAIFFLDFLRHHHIIDHLIKYLESVSSDYRIQTIILAWFLENFIEGIAGFGTPSTIVAPILVSLGLSPLSSVVLALLGNSTSVSFGAAGTPIRTGFASLDYSGVAVFTAAFNWVGLLIPVFMLWVVVAARKRPKTDFIAALPFALWSGFVYVFCSYLISFYSQELASILGAILGFILSFITLKLGVFIPPQSHSFTRKDPPSLHSATLLKTFSPYLVLIALLILGKNNLGSVSFPVFASQIQKFSLFNPGFAFLITTLIFSIIWPTSRQVLLKIFSKSVKSSLEPFLIIFLMSAIVQILTFSGHNLSGIISMLNTLVDSIKSIGVVFLSPFLGAFGSFITGSATISNIMFGQLLFQAATDLGHSPAVILALQLVGASLGNMIALSDMITAEIVVGIKNQESQLIRRLLPFCLPLIALTAFIGLTLQL